MTITNSIRNIMNHRRRGLPTPRQIRQRVRHDTMTEQERKAKKKRRDIALARSRRQHKEHPQTSGYVPSQTYEEAVTSSFKVVDGKVQWDSLPWPDVTSWEYDTWWCYNNNVGGQLNKKQREKSLALAEEAFGDCFDHAKKSGFKAH